MKIRFCFCVGFCTLLAACSQTTASVDAPASSSGATDARALALDYLQGRDVDRDPVQAVKLYTQSALQGDAASQAALGQLYEQGIGASQDSVAAYAWYQLSADQNDGDGTAGIQRIRPKLSQEQWNAAMALHDQLEAAIKE